MSLIYEPRGKAREYSPLALNVYAGGCDHGCTYCYCADMQRAFGRAWTATAVPRSLIGLDAEAAKARRQVLLCFVGDPYCAADVRAENTRSALVALRIARCSVAILTKGGARCLRDLDLFRDWPDGRIKVGATLTFADPGWSLNHEPGAALPEYRIDALRVLHEAGVKTWASIEPVIDAAQSLAVIDASLPYVDAYKVGKLNHAASAVDWQAFCVAAVDMIRSAGRGLYVKDDLRAFAPAGYLRQEECTPETVFLPDRPDNSEFPAKGQP
jgi:hypothetical protein